MEGGLPCHLVVREGMVHTALQSFLREGEKAGSRGGLGKPPAAKSVDHRLQDQAAAGGRPGSSFKNPPVPVFREILPNAGPSQLY